MRRSEIFHSFPYTVHTGRELGLMLRGEKPMATFGWIEGREIDIEQRYFRLFDHYVALDRLVRDLRTRPAQRPYKRYFELFYTLPGEEWRVQAVVDLLALPLPWTAAHERRFGELLGYEDWQNDYWLRHHFKGPAG